MAPRGFFDPNRDRRKRLRAAARDALDRGVLPARIKHRLVSLARSERFTSTLGAAGSLSARAAGCEPIGIVSGTAVYHMMTVEATRMLAAFRNNIRFSWATMGANVDGELTGISQAMDAMRLLAIQRLRDEAAVLGAHGVLGVQIRSRRLSETLVEFALVGTAVRVDGHSRPQVPFTSLLGAQEFLMLKDAGYWPVELIFGACCFTSTFYNNSIWGLAGGNREMSYATHALRSAQRLARDRLAAACKRAGGHGVVGVSMAIRRHFRLSEDKRSKSWIAARAVAMGTAVVRESTPDPASRQLVLSLSDGSLRLSPR